MGQPPRARSDDDRPTADEPAFRDRPTQAIPAFDRADPDRTQVRSSTSTNIPTRPAREERPPAPPPRQEPATGKRPPVEVRRLRRGRLAIRKISPWAMFKFSLVFYFCTLLIALLATAILFATLKAFGVIDNIEQLLRDLEFDVTISGGVIFRWMFLLGLVGTVVASAITVFLSFLYNLIADVVGGIELLVTERE